MTKDEFQATFDEKVKPWLVRFRQWVTDTPVAFWVIVALACYGAVRVFV